MEEKEIDEQKTVATCSENCPSRAISDGAPPPYAEVHRYAPISPKKERSCQIRNDNSTVLPSAPAQPMYGPYPSPYNPQYAAQNPPQGMYNFPMQVGPWGPPLDYPMRWPHANFGHPSSFQHPMHAGSQPFTSIANQQFPPQPFPMQWPHANYGIYPQIPPQLDQPPASETPMNSNAKQQLTPTQSHPLETTTDEELTMKAHSSLRFSHDGPSVKQRAQQHEKPKAPPVKPKKKVNHLSKALLSKLEDKPIMVCVQNPHVKPRLTLAERVIAKCSCDTKVKPLTYTLELKREKNNKKLDMIEKYTFGSKPRRVVPEKVLMIVGATGAGKSTLINDMINFIFGVRWEDKFRFKMIVENAVTQANSVTQKITSYTLYHQEGSPVNFTLTIVDTPGFGDTQGLERDRRIISQIKDFFSLSPPEGGVDHLDAIGFVTQAALARLTPTQRYIFDSILSIFGKNVGGNIFMMITFADGSKPPVVDAIKAAKIPYKRFFKFNNSAIYPSSEQKKQQTFDDSSDEEGEGGDFSHMFWDMGMKSFESFFLHFKGVEAQSLQLTNEVLQERHRLETTISRLQPQINEGLARIEELRREERILKEHENDILTNKDFKYTVTITKQRKVDLAIGHYVTNCLLCNFTCHEDCVYANDEDKWRCSAMDNGDSDTAMCRVCPGKCTWRKHVNNPYYFELYQEDEVRTQNDLKRNYAEAVQGKIRVESMITTIEDRLMQLDQFVMQMMSEVRKSSERLDQIALKPNPLTEVEYIDLLIESEKLEKKPGYLDHIKYYEQVRQSAQIHTGVLSMDTTTTCTPQGKGIWDHIRG